MVCAQVRSDCPPERLLEFLSSESAKEVDESAAAVEVIRAEEEELLEQVTTYFAQSSHRVSTCLYWSRVTGVTPLLLAPQVPPTARGPLRAVN